MSNNLMENNSYIKTIDFGYVPIRKTYNDGVHYQDITIDSYNDNECFGEIRIDFGTQQPFVVLFDNNWNEIR